MYRCWSPEDHARLPEHPTPEILTADLTSFLLETACWGSELASLALLDPPPEAAAAVARANHDWVREHAMFAPCVQAFVARLRQLQPA